MKQFIWTQNYHVNSFLVNPQKRLGLYGLLNLLQDSAWIHATHLDHGYEQMISEGNAWVLTRQKLQMKEWPKWGDEIDLRTWIHPISGPVAHRDFEILLNDKVIGLCNTQWLIMDMETRRPSTKSVSLSADHFRADAPEMISASKIKIIPDLPWVAQFQVRNSDLDLNGHVNNTRYAQWILDAVQSSDHQQYRLLEYEVNFLAETKGADVVEIFQSPNENGIIQFQGMRKQDGKVVFVAMLRVESV